MSIPTSAMAATAAGFTSAAGSEPPDETSAPSPARCRSHPAAIWERPALCTHRNTTLGGVPDSVVVLTDAPLRAAYCNVRGSADVGQARGRAARHDRAIVRDPFSCATRRVHLAAPNIGVRGIL